MSIKLFLLVVLSIPLPAAILPGVIGPWKQKAIAPLDVKIDRPLWDEYGLQDAEQGSYENASGPSLRVEAWRLADSSGALGAFDYFRPADAKPAPGLVDLTPASALIPGGALVALGNYLVRFEGAVPEQDAVANLFRSMPRLEHASLPTFLTYLPSGQTANSERYIEGPVALARFFPGIPPSTVGFHLGGEAGVAEYGPGVRMALFSYPTPAIARDREPELAKIPGAVVKRSGPLVAVVLHPADMNRTESLLAKVRWAAAVTTGERPPTKRDNPASLLLNIFYLIVILAVFCIASGIAFGFIRTVFRRGGASGEGEEILALHLEGR